MDRHTQTHRITRTHTCADTILHAHMHTHTCTFTHTCTHTHTPHAFEESHTVTSCCPDWEGESAREKDGVREVTSAVYQLYSVQYILLHNYVHVCVHVNTQSDIQRKKLSITLSALRSTYSPHAVHIPCTVKTMRQLTCTDRPYKANCQICFGARMSILQYVL